MRLFICLSLAIAAALPLRAEVKLTTETVGDHDCYRFDNGRISMLVDPAEGGTVVSYRDKLGGDVELISDKAPHGLCIDHFQSQVWPGEMYRVPYEVVSHKNDPQASSLTLRYEVKGVWRSGEDERLRGLTLEKTYTLRADTPAFLCTVTITAPKKGSKLFAYWQQHIFHAGGQFDRTTDKSFRPSSRGVRVKDRENWGHTGAEDFLRDGSAGWIALVDTVRKTGLVTLCDYNEIDSLYVNGGNVTVEPMYRITYLPAGQSVSYPSWIVPVTGLDNVVYASPEMIAGYQLETDGKGDGKLSLSAIRSVDAPASATLQVKVVNALDPKVQVDAGTITFDQLGPEPKSGALSFRGAGQDPLVLRVAVQTKDAAGKVTDDRFEEYFNGTWKWGENLQTDMVSPVYRGERPPQKLSLRKPDPLKLKDVPGYQYWYVEGLLDDLYRVTPGAQVSHTYRDGNNLDQRDRVFTSYSSNWLTRLSDFPYDYDQLLSYDMIILGGLKKESLGNVGMEMLCDYVNAGGGVMMLGGPMAYGASRLQGTPLAELLPVTMAGTPFDLVKSPGALIKPTKDGAPFLEDLDWSPGPSVNYLHDVKVKEWGTVVLEADGRPFLVIGEVGPAKARVACFLGAPMGEFPGRQLPFWKWSDWTYLMRQLDWWLLKQDDLRFRANDRW